MRFRKAGNLRATEFEIGHQQLPIETTDTVAYHQLITRIQHARILQLARKTKRSTIFIVGGPGSVSSDVFHITAQSVFFYNADTKHQFTVVAVNKQLGIQGPALKFRYCTQVDPGGIITFTDIVRSEHCGSYWFSTCTIEGTAIQPVGRGCIEKHRQRRFIAWPPGDEIDQAGNSPAAIQSGIRTFDNLHLSQVQRSDLQQAETTWKAAV